MSHTMLDLETMGSSAGCAVVSIGAVEFDYETDTLGRKFYRIVSLEDCMKHGLRAEASTISWWLKQSEQAREAIAGGIPLGMALTHFAEWLDRDTQLWSHGASFDLPVLVAALRAAGMQPPWQFRNERDTRTVLWLADERIPKIPDAHHAQIDAENQAMVIMKSLRKIRARIA